MSNKPVKRDVVWGEALPLVVENGAVTLEQVNTQLAQREDLVDVSPTTVKCVLESMVALGYLKRRDDSDYYFRSDWLSDLTGRDPIDPAEWFVTVEDVTLENPLHPVSEE